MLIGVPKEIKNHEYRVGLVPAGVRELVASGHQVLVQSTAGAGIGVEDAAYVAAGAKIVATAKDVFDGAEMVVKVKRMECVLLLFDGGGTDDKRVKVPFGGDWFNP